ncbi:MAG TPA: fatty acid desaturase, partial [Acidobacteriota bacterium]|nr:fatty acid desaturase [Acidobacteriota bacterium]
HDEIRRLHRIRPWKHFLIVFRQYALLAAATAALAYFTNPLIWIPLALVQGFTIFNFTVLLHEVVHNAVFVPGKSSRKFNRIMGLVYAFPSGISASQFTKWHLDHHAGLGSPTEDPKRFRLSPKVNKRWLKILYFTPALFFIYFRAAALETATYKPELQKTINLERLLTILFQLSLMGLCYWLGGAGVMVRVYVVPVFLIFPIAFALNRLGQHYNIRPEDPAQWSTLMKSSWFWNFAFLYSNFHLEHHYFPGVPFYNLARVHRLMQPFYKARGMKAYGYAELIYRYIVLNGQPHTDWEPQAIGTPPLAAAL